MSDDLATLLLQLRLRAFATVETLAGLSALGADRVDALLVDAESDRLVQRRGGPAVGWTLTASGRRRGRDLLVAEMDAAGAGPSVLDAYEQFLPLNAELLSICTDWQVLVVDGETVPNDHTDTVRDAAVLARLDALHPAAMEVVGTLGRALDRFAGYGARLDGAHQQVRAGRTDWLTRVTEDSYHGIWFELHEHLLTVLGRDREHERVPAYTPTSTGPADGPTTNGDVP